MASAASGSGSVRPFPLQLAHGVLRDLLLKELDARLAPDDEPKRAAFSASRDSLARRLALLMPQFEGVDGAGVVAGVYALVREQWKAIFGHRSLVRIQPSVLQSSLWLETFVSVFKTACAPLGPWEGGALVIAALQGIDTIEAPFSSLPPETVAQMVALMEWWGDDVCSKLLNVGDAWGWFDSPSRPLFPMVVLAALGLEAFVPLAVARGCSVNGDFTGSSRDSPAAVALRNGRVGFVEVLLANGLDLMRPYEGDGWPLALRLFHDGHGQAAFLSDLLRSRPELARVSTSPTASEHVDLLGAAIHSGDSAVVDAAFAAGAAVEHRGVLEGDKIVRRPTLAIAISSGIVSIVELVITKGKALEAWKDKYDDVALACISESLATLAVSAYPSNPDFTGDRAWLKPFRPQALECLQIVLANGFVHSWNRIQENALLHELYSRDSHNFLHDCVMAEQHALALLQQFHGAGFDVLDISNERRERRLQLQQAAAIAKQPKVMEWAFNVLKASPDPDDGNVLFFALGRKALSCASLLIDKYGVRTAFPERPLEDQPVFGVIWSVDKYTDAEAEKWLKKLMDRNPMLFSLPCYSPDAVAEYERYQHIRKPGGVAPWNPLYVLTHSCKPLALEAILSRNLDGVASMANRPVQFSGQTWTAALRAAHENFWECLGLLLRYTDARVTDKLAHGLSVAALVQAAAGKAGGPPRPLQVAVEARAKKELAEKAKTAAAIQAAVATTTNAFEDPASKLLTAEEEKEAKAKAKKKAAKKKAKAKKKASASAGAGHAAAAGSDSSSSDGDTDDDEDEDVRYAPDFDALKAQMAQMNLKEE